MSSDLFDTYREPIDNLTKDLAEIGDFNEELRVGYKETPETVFLDECIIMDYIGNRGRRMESSQFGDNYFEGPQDIERLLETFDGELIIPVRFQNRNPRRNDISERLEKINNKAEHLDLDQIEPREGFRELDHADHRDKRIAEFCYEENAVVATYDDDFLEFPVNYTTPGMLL